MHYRVSRREIFKETRGPPKNVGNQYVIPSVYSRWSYMRDLEIRSHLHLRAFQFVIEFNSHRKHPARSESFRTDGSRWLLIIFSWHLLAFLRFCRAHKWSPYSSRWSSYTPVILTRSLSMSTLPKTCER